MSAPPRVRKASWMSSRAAQRIRRRRNQCRWVNARPTDPALGAQTGAVLGAPAVDQRLHTEIPDRAAVLVMVVAAVAQHHVRAAPGPTALAPHRRHRFEQRDMSWVTSLRLPPVSVAASGMPVASVIRWCLLPVLPPSTGLGPSWNPLQRRDVGAVDGSSGEVQGIRAAELGKEDLVPPGPPSWRSFRQGFITPSPTRAPTNWRQRDRGSRHTAASWSRTPRRGSPRAKRSAAPSSLSPALKWLRLWEPRSE